MSAYLTLPIAFLKFWFLEAPIGMFHFFGLFNRSLIHWLSLPLLLETFLKPLKNEYREGLVGFSIGMGIFVKTVLILIDLIIFLFVFVLEIVAIILFVGLPFLSLYVLFAGGSL